MSAHTISSSLWSGALFGAALLSGCATPPKPHELEAFEQLKGSSNYAAAQKRAPQLVEESDKLFRLSREAWNSNHLENARRDALMGSVKLKTAMALVEQDQARARLSQLNGELNKSEDEYARVAKDLAQVSEQVSLMKKLQETKSAAAADREKLARQLSEEQTRAQAREKLAAAELAVKSAEAVEAATYAKEEYASASDTLSRARGEFKSGSFSAAQVSSDLAKEKAERATDTAKPAFLEAEQSKSGKARDEALGRDAAGLQGVTVRLERRGDTQRLVLPLRNLFAKRSTVVTPGQEAVIDALSQLLKKYPSYSVMVVGHTDNKGRHDELVALSLARAQSVFSALVSRGVEAKRLMASGQGPDEALTENRTSTGRAQNNRVEVVFIYQ